MVMVGNHDRMVMPSPIPLCGLSPYKHLVIMKVNPICRICGVELNDENWYPSCQKRYQHICKSCDNERKRQWAKANPEKVKVIQIRSRRKQGMHPFNKNKKCSLYLGVHIAEQILSQAFKNVQRMPYGNPGFDFICNKGYMVDVKGSCLNKDGAWCFNIRHNITADYFLCLAFDNREDLNPLHAWLIPGSKLNHLIKTTIRLGTIYKWDDYRLDVTKVAMCCDAMRS